MTLRQKADQGHSWVDLWTPNPGLTNHFLDWRLEFRLRNWGCHFFSEHHLTVYPPKLSTERKEWSEHDRSSEPQKERSGNTHAELWDTCHMHVWHMQIQLYMLGKEMKMEEISVIGQEILLAISFNFRVYPRGAWHRNYNSLIPQTGLSFHG